MAVHFALLLFAAFEHNVVSFHFFILSIRQLREKYGSLGLAHYPLNPTIIVQAYEAQLAVEFVHAFETLGNCKKLTVVSFDSININHVTSGEYYPIAANTSFDTPSHYVPLFPGIQRQKPNASDLLFIVLSRFLKHSTLFLASFGNASDQATRYLFALIFTVSA